MKFFDFLNRLSEKFSAGELNESEDPAENEISFFDFTPSGMAYAATKKKPARVTIALPRCVCGESLSDLYEWDIKIIAIKRKVVDDILEENKQ